MKRIITFALFILLVIGALMPTVFAEESVVYGTENGGKIKWTFDKTSGVLTVIAVSK